MLNREVSPRYRKGEKLTYINRLLFNPGTTGKKMPPGFPALEAVPAGRTGGAVSVVEHLVPAGVLFAPIHTHSREDELTYVLEGAIGVLLGDGTGRAGTGSYIFKPRDIPHTFWNDSQTQARVVEIIIPGGFEKYFGELALLLKKQEPGKGPDAQAMMALGIRYGLRFDMEGTMALLSKHGLRLL